MTDWESIVHEHRPLVWRTVYRLVGNHADALDCFQQVFLDAVKVDRKEPVREWSPLLRRLAVSRALDLLRARCRSRARAVHSLDGDLVASSEPGPQENAEARELAGRLRDALAKLPPRHAEVFCLCRLEGVSYGEAAGQLGTNANAVGVLLHRACQRLQQLLTSDRVDSGRRK